MDCTVVPSTESVARILGFCHCRQKGSCEDRPLWGAKNSNKIKDRAADNGGLIRLCRFLLPVPTIKEKGLEACLKKGNLKQAEHHLAIAKWNAEGAKTEIAAVGRSKSER